MFLCFSNGTNVTSTANSKANVFLLAVLLVVVPVLVFVKVIVSTMGTNIMLESTERHANTATSTNSFRPRDDWTLLKQGAEARIWMVPNGKISDNGNDNSVQTTIAMICKERFAKKYRHPILDARLTKQRCRMEARLLGKCKEKGINVPTVLQVDSSFSDATSLIYLEFINGQTVRDYLEEILLPQLEIEGSDPLQCLNMLRQIAEEIGKTISKLHEVGVVHGDLTTSNIMLRDIEIMSKMQQPNIVFIDFGLAKNTTAIEERAVDLYVLERALQSTHPTLPPSFHESLLSAYVGSTDLNDVEGSTVKASSSKGFKHETLMRLEKVRQRGRKRECFG